MHQSTAGGKIEGDLNQPPYGRLDGPDVAAL